VLGPFGRVGASPAQHEVAERRDETGLLGERNELGRRDVAARRVRPAQQRLEADDVVRFEVDERLVVDL
jgi:hypothetical protein